MGRQDHMEDCSRSEDVSSVAVRQLSLDHKRTARRMGHALVLLHEQSSTLECSTSQHC